MMVTVKEKDTKAIALTTMGMMMMSETGALKQLTLIDTSSLILRIRRQLVSSHSSRLLISIAYSSLFASLCQLVPFESFHSFLPHSAHLTSTSFISEFPLTHLGLHFTQCRC